MRKYSKYLFLLGIALSVAGIVTGVISGDWSLQPVGLIVAGIVLICLWLYLVGGGEKGFWGRRSTVVGTNAFVATAAVIVILGLINFLAVRNSVRLDLTENQLFTLSPQSQEIVRDLSQPLKVWVFDREVNPSVKQLLENYRRNSQNFQFEFADPDVQIGLAEQFKVQAPGEVYLEYGNKKQLIVTINPQLGQDISEIQLTNAIEKIQRDRPLYLYFIQGHGEPSLDGSEGSLSQAVTSLENKGFTVQPLNLAQRGKVPENTNVIVLAGPKRELFEAEVQALKDYLDRGGSLLLMLEPNTNPGLEPLLKEWGVQLDDRFVIDASGAGSFLGFGPAAPLIESYGNHPITKDFGNGISVYPNSRPLGTVKVKSVDPVALVVTNEQSWGESNLNTDEVAFDPQQDIKGPIDLAIAFTRTESKKEKEKIESRMVVFGSSTFAVNGWFAQQLNGDIFLNSVSWLGNQDEQPLSIRPKEQTNRRIYLTPLQAGIIEFTALLIMPLLGLITALITWWRRR